MQRGSGFNVTLSSDNMDTGDSSNVTHDFRNDFTPAIQLDREAAAYEVSLLRVDTWFSAYNIDQTQYNNNTLRYSTNAGVVWKNITITPGNYSAPQLVAYITDEITANGDDIANLTFVINYSTGKFELVLANNYHLDLSVSNLYVIFGADSAIYTASTVFPRAGNIANNVNSYLIAVDGLIEGYGQGTVQNGVLCQFRPYGPPSGPISFSPSFENSIKMSRTREIHSLRVRLLDQRLRRVDLRGEPLTLTMHLRPLYKV